MSTNNLFLGSNQDKLRYAGRISNTLTTARNLNNPGLFVNNLSNQSIDSQVSQPLSGWYYNNETSQTTFGNPFFGRIHFSGTGSPVHLYKEVPNYRPLFLVDPYADGSVRGKWMIRRSNAGGIETFNIVDPANGNDYAAFTYTKMPTDALAGSTNDTKAVHTFYAQHGPLDGGALAPTNRPAFMFTRGATANTFIIGCGDDITDSGGQNLAAPGYLSTRDDSGTTAPTNFLYTNSAGLLLSSAIESILSGATIPTYADQAAADGNVDVGDLFKDSTGALYIKT